MTPGGARLAATLLALAFPGVVSAAEPGADLRAAGRELIAYLPSWELGPGGFSIATLPAAQLTGVSYAFSTISRDGRCTVERPVRFRLAANRLLALKRAHPHLRLYVSVGGWSGSARFSQVAATKATRQRFARSCVNLFIRGRFPGARKPRPGIFDGIDIDWEYPAADGLQPGRAVDRTRFPLLLKALRTELRRVDRRLVLSAAVAATGEATRGVAVADVAPLVDWLGVMAYDLHGDWEPYALHHSPLFSTGEDPTWRLGKTASEAIDAYLERGVPASRLVLGVPFYAIGRTGATQGLYGPASGPALQLPWREADALGPEFGRFTDKISLAAWAWDPVRAIFYGFDDPQSIVAKMSFARSRGLRGAMAWEVTQDDRFWSLTRAAAGGLLQATR